MDQINVNFTLGLKSDKINLHFFHTYKISTRRVQCHNVVPVKSHQNNLLISIVNCGEENV